MLSAQPELIWQVKPTGLSPKLVGEFKPTALKEIQDSAVKQNIITLNKRVNELAVKEPVIQQQGAERIVVQLPGVQDTARAKDIIGRTATLESRLADPSVSSIGFGETPPPGTDTFRFGENRLGVFKKSVIFSGDRITDASAGFDQNQRPAVNISLDAAGGRVMQEVTRENIGKPMGMILFEKGKGEVLTIATIQGEFGSKFQITGQPTTASANDLALLLRAGSLAAPMEIIEERTIGPSLGAENIEKGFKSLLIGFGAIAIFMMAYYLLFGTFSVIALAVNLLLLISVLSMLQATLTLPGIAAMALALGMAIDSNVLINERIREELRNGAAPQTAIAVGFDKAWATILDSNVTTLIAGLALLAFGSGPIKGFAVVHCLGILTSMFSAVFFLWHNGLHLSIEFTGGTVMEVSYPQAAPLDSIRAKVEKLGYADTQIQNFGSSRDIMIRLPLQKDTEGKLISSADRSAAVMQVLDPASSGAKLQRVEFVGPQVGQELAMDGLKALIFVIIGIVIYLSFRFEWKFAVAGIIANLHDIVIILGFFAFFQWEFSLSVLAAVLAVLGYSVNESVVIFDRIRENFRKYRKMNTREIIDNAITSTISRTVITHGSTEMMVLAMLIFGGPTLFYFALALTIGILFGIYSSVFVAAALAMWLGVTREDLVKGDKKPDDNTRNDDPNFGARV